MSNNKTSNTPKKTNDNDKWKTTGGAMRPVDLSKIKLVNTPKKTK